MSLPSRERGLKSNIGWQIKGARRSLPSRERGLKFPDQRKKSAHSNVAPLAGAWIEIINDLIKFFQIRSLPSRERGLKSSMDAISEDSSLVAPLAGAWIEIPEESRGLLPPERRSPRGSVD